MTKQHGSNDGCLCVVVVVATSGMAWRRQRGVIKRYRLCPCRRYTLKAGSEMAKACMAAGIIRQQHGSNHGAENIDSIDAANSGW